VSTNTPSARNTRSAGPAFSDGSRAPKRTGYDPGPTGNSAASLIWKQKQVAREAVLKRIAEIDAKFQATEGWLHPTVSRLARERELLMALANRQFNPSSRIRVFFGIRFVTNQMVRSKGLHYRV
jgi:hypothetical protein